MPVKIESCKDNWVAWGGLKWANHTTFQDQLDAEGIQSDEGKCKNPRQYSEMVFKETAYMKNRVNKIFKQYT